jgi:hypothetical protein
MTAYIVILRMCAKAVRPDRTRNRERLMDDVTPHKNK